MRMRQLYPDSSYKLPKRLSTSTCSSQPAMESHSFGQAKWDTGQVGAPEAISDGMNESNESSQLDSTRLD